MLIHGTSVCLKKQRNCNVQYILSYRGNKEYFEDCFIYHWYSKLSKS